MVKLNTITFNGNDLYFCSNAGNNIEILSSADLSRITNICRLNCLSMIKFAGSGHVGSSFSAAEIMSCVKFVSSSTMQDLENFQGAVFFSSKGHDAPMFYSVMHAFGELSDADLLTLRRFGGLPGHPTLDVIGVATNTGSLGMGISKAKGMIYANRINRIKKKVVVLLGDGELQEGQIWEALPGAHRDNLAELVVIVDANGIQSDSWVSKTLDLGDVKSRVSSFGWNYIECNGNSTESVISALKRANLSILPTWIHAQTIKGCGVSFMEKFSSNGDYYQYHSGAPNAVDYESAINEIIAKIELNQNYKDKSQLDSNSISNEINDNKPNLLETSVTFRYALILSEIVKSNDRIIVLDGDLNRDTGTFLVKKEIPSNYLQCGIAEQDMVSIAGGLALNNLIPIVHSFGTFLTMRGYEQIYNNSTEHKTIVYVGFLAGLLPSMPGISHQAVNDFPIMNIIPNMKLYEPASDYEMKQSINRAIQYSGPSYIRIQSVGANSKNTYSTYKEMEYLTIWKESESQNVIICSGLTMLEQALLATEELEKNGTFCTVMTIFDYGFEKDLDSLKVLDKYTRILVLENYLPGNLLFNKIRENLVSKKTNSLIKRLGLNEFPKCGQNNEVLLHHNLDAKSIARLFLDSTTWA